MDCQRRPLECGTFQLQNNGSDPGTQRATRGPFQGQGEALRHEITWTMKEQKSGQCTYDKVSHWDEVREVVRSLITQDPAGHGNKCNLYFKLKGSTRGAKQVYDMIWCVVFEYHMGCCMENGFFRGQGEERGSRGECWYKYTYIYTYICTCI
jgi:hypothetical protein